MLDLAKLTLSGPTILLTDNPTVQYAVEARLAQRGVAGVRVTPSVGLAMLILERALEPIPDPSPTAIRRRILAETLDKNPGDFAQLYARAPRQTVGMLLRLVEEAGLEEFNEADVKADKAIFEIVRQRFKAIRDLAAAYRARLEKEHADEVTIIRRAAAIEGPKQAWSVVTLDRHVPHLVRKLIKPYSVADIPSLEEPPIPVDHITVLRPRDAVEEAEVVAQQILRTNLKSWRDAVVVADASTAPLIAGELQAHGIPVAGGWSRSLGTSGGWRLVEAWLRILTGNFGPGEIASALLGLGPRKFRGRALRVSKEALKRWTSTGDALRALADKETDLDLMLKKVRTDLSVSAAIDWVRTHVLAPHDAGFYASPTPEGTAIRQEIRISLELVSKLGDAGTLQENLDEALRSAPRIKSGLPTGGVEILLEACDPGRDVKLVIATGFVRGRYPQTPPTSAIIGDIERASAGLPVAADQLTDRRARLLELLGACTGDIIFTAPHRHEGEWVEPSLFLDEILSKVPDTWKRKHTVDLGAPGVASWPPSAATRRVALRAVTLGLQNPNPPAELLQAAKALASDPDSRDLLEAPLRPKRDFKLGRSADVTKVAFSPSNLPPSLACPYHFFASHLLGLEDVAVAGRAELGALELGTMAHSVMQRLNPDVRQGTATADRAVALLDDVVREDLPWARAPQFGLSLNALRHNLRDFLPRYLDLLKALKAVPLESELQLRDDKDKRPLFPLPSRAGIPKAVPMGGRIDQPIKLANGLCIVVDFKFGKVVDRVSRQSAVGMDAQAPIYSWYMRQDGRHPAPAGAIYISITRPEAVFRPTKQAGTIAVELGGRASVVATPVLEDAEVQLANAIADVLAAMTRPDADVTPVDSVRWEELNKAEANPCRYCSYGLLCRDRKRK